MTCIRASVSGPIWAFSFVILEAAQAVFFGSVFQNTDSFLIGVVVFGATAVATLIYAYARTPCQLAIAWSNRSALLWLNISTALVWVAYFFALQLIEPAVAFTIFSGLIPISIVLASCLNVPEASPIKNWLEGVGLFIVLIGVVYLSAATLLGTSGFVREGRYSAISGLILSYVAAASLAGMMIYSQRLDRLGVAPIAQYGLRFPLYVVLACAAVALGIDHKGPIDRSAFVGVVLAGLVLIAFPVFAMQKAISLMSSLSLAVITALGPLFVFAFQLLEGRVAYASATMTGLFIYFVGAMLAASGGAKDVSARKVGTHAGIMHKLSTERSKHDS